MPKKGKVKKITERWAAVTTRKKHRAKYEIVTRIDKMLKRMERLHLAEYVHFMSDKKRLFKAHFMAGISRGLGMAIGFSLLGALVIYLLQLLASNNNFLSKFVGDIMNIIEQQKK